MSDGADVVQVLLSERIGGAETLAATLQRQWRARGLRAETVYLDPPDRVRAPLERVRHLREALHGLRPRAVLAHSALPNVYARIAAPRGATVVVVMHGGDDFADPKLRWAERLLRLRTRAVVTVNEEQRAVYLRRFGDRVPTEQISNAIADTMRPPEGSGTAPTTGTVAATVARVVPQKQPEFWAEVAGACVEALPRLRFEWWGPVGEDAETASTRVRVDGSPNARLRGSTDEPERVYAGASLLFHPARAEAQSIGLLEAAACGLPIVCSDAVGATLDPRVPRAEYPVGDVDGAVRALAATLDDLAAATARALVAAPAIAADYSADACADRYAALLGLARER